VSGVASMQVSASPSFCTDWQHYQTTAAWTGTGTAYARFRDNAGNVSATYSTAPADLVLTAPRIAQATQRLLLPVSFRTACLT
jgi:hypothetical protein